MATTIGEMCDVRGVFLTEGAEVVASSPEQFRDHLKLQLEAMARITKDIKMRGE